MMGDTLTKRTQTESRKRPTPCRSDVNDWIELRNQELEEVGPTSDDLKTALEQKEKIKEVSARVADYEPTFKDATDGAYQVIKDPVIPTGEKMALQTELNDREDRWDDLNNTINERVDRRVPEIPAAVYMFHCLCVWV